MSTFSLSADDLPPEQPLPLDNLLRSQLEDAIGRRLYESCDGVTQSVLASCQWHVTTQAEALTLVIQCPDAATNWRVLNNLVLIATYLEAFTSSARIRVSPPAEVGVPFEMRVDEIAIYRDL